MPKNVLYQRYGIIMFSVVLVIPLHTSSDSEWVESGIETSSIPGFSSVDNMAMIYVELSVSYAVEPGPVRGRQ